MKTDFALLFLRVSVGLMMALGHGWDKLTRFAEVAERFPDPIGLGSSVSLALAVFAEFFCSIAVALGIATRYATLPIIVTMCIAVFLIHGSDPFYKKELALLYLVSFSSILFLGSGKFSADKIPGLSKLKD